ncbi:MAG: ATP-binding protein [Deltaproteobacteria bacterium]|nr:ATP-binding protein [Deltaproteobacteria bacterium]
MIELIKILQGEFQEKDFSGSIPREVDIRSLSGRVSVLMGMRRVGKTYCLHQCIDRLLKKGISKTRILYINFEDERLLPCDAMMFGQLVESFFTLYPENHDQRCYLFFDEIQNIDHWPVVIRRLLDQKNIEITITGSSAKMLSKEIATSLRGRAVATEIWPFSFHEFLQAQGEEFPGKVLGPKKRDHYLQQFQNYLRTGGFPEVVMTEGEHHKIILQDYVNTVVYRDIVERHGVTNLTLLKQFIRTLLKSTGARLAIQKTFRDFKSQGYAVSKNTLHSYLEMIEDAYLCFAVPLFTDSIRKQNVNPRKIYTIDTGLVLANTLQFSDQYGALFENLIYLDLRRQGCEVYYFQMEDQIESDFVASFPDGRKEAFQVCFNLGEKTTLQREKRGALAAQSKLKIKSTIVDPLSYITQEWVKG